VVHESSRKIFEKGELKMPVRMTPEEFAEKHARRLKGSIEDIRAGIARVSESPTAKAAAKADKMLNNLTEAVRGGKWARRLQSVTLEQWKSATTEKGLGRIAAGIDSARQKQIEFAQQLFAYQNSLLSQIEKMPDMTLEDSINRATAWIRGMSKFARK
jgi:hypothetical protein